MDYNSTVNQSIKDKFVSLHVYLCVNVLIDDLKDEVRQEMYDEFSNYWMYNVDGEDVTPDQLSEMISELEQKLDEATTDEEIKSIEERIDELNNLESEPQEIFEYWAVSSFLADKLKANGHCIWYNGQNYIWGRTTTGQAILLDYCISQICEEMQILEGQENQWNV